MANFKEDLTKVKAFIFDVDGVFSATVTFLHPNGDVMRSTNIKDGFAVQHAVKQGYKICIISGGKYEAVRKRFEYLGVKDIYLGAHHKIEKYEEFVAKYNLNEDEILYMGDDLPDYPVMKRVGVPTCPQDAAEEIKAISSYISNYKGGEACARDVIEQVLRAQGKWLVPEVFEW